jgi:hypothetical protein
MRYIVTWQIDIEAGSPRQAAQQALDIQRDSESTATYFEVRKFNTQTVTAVDLLKKGKAT